MNFCGENNPHWQGGKIEAHHVRPFSQMMNELTNRNGEITTKDVYNKKEVWKIENGRTLCSPCHKKTSTWGAGALKYQFDI